MHSIRMKPEVLARFDINVVLIVSTDALSFGFGAVLLEQNFSPWQPVAFASRVM